VKRRRAYQPSSRSSLAFKEAMAQTSCTPIGDVIVWNVLGGR
jgi:hypothetical protein